MRILQASRVAPPHHGQPRYIKNGVTLKNLGQTIGKVAGQAALAGALAQFKGKFCFLRFYRTADKPNVISTVFCATKKRVKKPFARLEGKILSRKL